MNTTVFRSHLRSRTSSRALLLGLAASLAIAPAALAQNTVSNTSATSSLNLDLGSVLATGTLTNSGDPSIPGTAANVAPTRASLKETQPTSVISSQFVQHNMNPLVNYTDIMNLSPSASSTNEEGPGLTESHNAQLRGFQDGMYNVTFDGIPYGDSNDFTHHSTTFFAAHDVGETIIDRGPGTASTVGNATFGGTVAIISKDPSATRGITAYGTYGSYETYMGGAEGDTGSFGPYGTQFMIDGAYSGSNTAVTNGKIARSNVFAKLVQPLNANFVVTAVAMYNNTYQQYSIGATKGEIATYGSDYALSSNPLSQNYYGYNTDHYKTDFEYIDLRGEVADGWKLDAKVYTYAYYHHSLNGFDNLDCPEQGYEGCSLVATNSATLVAKNGELAGATSTTNASGTVVPGQYKFNTYRSFGTIDRLEHDFALFSIPTTFKTGFWFDNQANTRALIDQNLNAGNTNLGTASGSSEPIERLMHDSLDTFQPYLQFDLHPVDGLTISPGAKFDYFRRGINTPVNQKTLLPLGYEQVYTKGLLSLEANYALTQYLSVYAQYASGFLAPNLNALYSIPANLNQSTLKPQVSTNYQAGVIYQSPRFAGDADVYYIPFTNLANSTKVNGYSVFFNGGGAIYEGLEAEGTYVVGYGFDIYANGSLNKATYNGTQGHDWVAETPQATGALGLLFDNGVFNASAIDKWTGGKYGVASNSKVTALNYNRSSKPFNSDWFDPYNTLDLSAGVDVPHGFYGTPPATLTLNVDNVTNQKQAYDYAGMTTGVVNAPSQELVYTLPGISYFVNLSVPLNF
jgi:iron complex outermembrane receptor protein